MQQNVAVWAGIPYAAQLYAAATRTHMRLMMYLGIAVLCVALILSWGPDEPPIAQGPPIDALAIETLP